jgi:hypothetical protein
MYLKIIVFFVGIRERESRKVNLMKGSAAPFELGRDDERDSVRAGAKKEQSKTHYIIVGCNLVHLVCPR